MITTKFYTLIFTLVVLVSYAQPKKEYYDSEQLKLKSETNIVKGMPHDKHVEYYKTGTISRKGSFYNGKEDSTWYFYYENGTVKAIETYQRGNKNGYNRYYFKNQ
jgi:antitoxin component YwqK of YwqJK toxin-antitoxin module